MPLMEMTLEKDPFTELLTDFCKGKFAVCSKGRIGRVDGRAKSIFDDNEEVYVGTGVFDGQPWGSSNPRFLSDADKDALELVLEQSWKYDGLKE